MIRDAVYNSPAGYLKLAALLLLVFPVVAFPVMYFLRSNWRATPTGRGLLYSSISLALAVVQSAVLLTARTFGVELGTFTALWQFAVFAFMNLTAWFMLKNLLRIQREDRRTVTRPEQEATR